MSKWGRDPDVKPVVDRTCKCGRPVRVRYLHKRKLWKVTNKCNSCGRSQAPWARHKKDKCERCGFVAENLCQLDVDHIDGNKLNNDPSNWQTLCANCHRLKTHEEREYESRYHNGVAINADGIRR